MPSFLLLLVMSLTMASLRANDNFRSPEVAAKSIGAINAAVHDVTVEPEASAPDDVATAPAAIAIIEAQAANLSMQSETDAPITVKFWASEKIELTPDDVATLTAQIGAPVEMQTVAAFFENAARIEDWMNDDEKARAQQFQKFIVTLQTQLENPRVYLFGERERTVIIIGKVKGGFGGVATLVVET